MNTSNIYRETTLDKISEDDVTKTLRIAGWVENIRDHGRRICGLSDGTYG